MAGRPRVARARAGARAGAGAAAQRPDEPPCTPIDLGPWVQKWLDEPVCVRWDWWERLWS
nr:hypothetical protein [Streptomyces sp. CC228A]